MMNCNVQTYNEYLSKILDRWTREIERSIWAGHYESEKEKINLCFDVANSKAREVYKIDQLPEKVSCSEDEKQPENFRVVPTKKEPISPSYFEFIKPKITPEKATKPIVLEKTLRELDLPSHLHNLLHKANIKLVSELVSIKQNKLEMIFEYNEKHILDLIFILNNLKIKHNFSLNKYIQQELKSFDDKLKTVNVSRLPSVPETLTHTEEKPEIIKEPKKEVINISDFEFTPRVHGRLNFAGIKTLDDLLSKSTDDLLNIPSFGKSHLKYIIEDLDANNVKHSFNL